LKNYIKKESFYAIARLIFECAEDGISRREIAERCRFSPMTVGKVVAILEQKGLVAQIRA
jgi:DNA-binding GntR family transcriptional regulator